ncbi:hypothetical protein B296_00000121, partial [Ensete ventricosum]
GGATMSSGSLSKVAVIGSGSNLRYSFRSRFRFLDFTDANMICQSPERSARPSWPPEAFRSPCSRPAGVPAGGCLRGGLFLEFSVLVYGWCRETTEDGRVLFFDHGAPYFSVSDKEVMGVVRSWEARGLVSEWQVPFGSFDQSTGKFVDFEKHNISSFIFSECWVLHSTAEYAQGVIARTGLKKLSSGALSKVAEELLREFQATGINIPHPFFMKAHRWLVQMFRCRGSAFPAIAIGGDEKCLWDKNKRLAICGDFCASPDVEGAVLSGIRAASKIMEKSSNL